MITRKLPVKLTNDELLVIGKRLADTELEVVQLKDEKKESMAEFKQREEAVRNNITRLTRALHDGVEWRPVECIESYNYDRGIVETFRTDTYDVVDWRSMSHEERQQKLPFPIEETPAVPKAASCSSDNVKQFFKKEEPAPVEQSSNNPTTEQLPEETIEEPEETTESTENQLEKITFEIAPHGDAIFTNGTKKKLVWCNDLKTILQGFKKKSIDQLDQVELDIVWTEYAEDHEPIEEDITDTVKPLEEKRAKKRKSKPVISAAVSGD
jgi:hypothetical protein